MRPPLDPSTKEEMESSNPVFPNLECFISQMSPLENVVLDGIDSRSGKMQMRLSESKRIAIVNY